MNKAEFNNEIVLMRKTVRQTKVHIIRKLVREIRLLKEKKNPEGNEKFKAKADRLYEELTIIKKLDCDVISKHALTLNEDPKKILSKAESVNDRALNRVAIHKSIIDKVKSIKDKYNINENLDKALEPGKKKLRKIKHIEAKTKKKQIKQENAAAAELRAKRQAWLEEHNVTPMEAGESTEDNDKKVKNVDKSTSSFEVDDNSVSSEDEVHQKNDKIKRDKIKEDSDEEGSEDVEIEDVEENSETENESQVEQTNFVRINKPQTKTKDKKLKNKVDETDDVDMNASKTVDDFFITDSGTHYESTYIPKPVKEQQHDDGLNRQQRRAQQFGNVVKRKPKKFNKESFTNGKAVNNQKEQFKHNKFSNGKESLKFKEKQPKKFVKEQNDKPKQETKQEVSLHPSWEAKKKLKPQITAFQGKKIVFDD